MSTINVLNASRRPVDLPSGQVLAPAERAEVEATEQLFAKIACGLLREVKAEVSGEPLEESGKTAAPVEQTAEGAPGAESTETVETPTTSEPVDTDKEPVAEKPAHAPKHHSSPRGTRRTASRETSE